MRLFPCWNNNQIYRFLFVDKGMQMTPAKNYMYDDPALFTILTWSKFSQNNHFLQFPKLLFFGSIDMANLHISPLPDYKISLVQTESILQTTN